MKYSLQNSVSKTMQNTAGQISSANLFIYNLFDGSAFLLVPRSLQLMTKHSGQNCENKIPIVKLDFFFSSE